MGQHRFIDIARETFDRLTADSFAGRDQHGGAMWNCTCKCKTSVVVSYRSLRSGKTRSCGCLQREYWARIEHGATVGGLKTPEYIAWAHIQDRCFNPRNKSYKNYGGRGITICPEWRYDFAAFLAYIGPRPSPKHSIDRFPNNDGNYEPGNIRWATWTEQARNKRSNRMITINGETICLKDWAKRMHIHHGVVSYRLTTMKWSPEKALSAPVIRGGRH